MPDKYANYIVEIRTKPNPRFLDKRGQIAQQLLNQHFDLWEVSLDSINLKKKDDTSYSGFFTYKHLGVTSQSPLEKADFKNIAETFIRDSWQHFNTDEITRIGVRSRFLIQATDFTKLFDSLRKKFLGLDDEALKKYGGTLIDLAFPLNFIEGDNYFNVNMGPMEAKQMKETLGVDAPFNVGLYVDVDYFTKDVSPHITQKRVLQLLKDGVSKADHIVNLLTKQVEL